MDAGKVVGRVVSCLRDLAGYGILLAGVLIVWQVVLSLHAVQRSGYLIWPYRTAVFPAGLPWVVVINVAFATVFLSYMVSLGSAADKTLTKEIPRLPQIGSIAHLAGILLAVIIGYLNYDDLVVPMLYSQGVDWIYRLAFALVVAGIGLAIAFEIWQAAQSAMKSRSPVITLPQGPLDGIRREEGHDMVCGRCGTALPGAAKYCSHCGEKVTRGFGEGGEGKA